MTTHIFRPSAPADEPGRATLPAPGKTMYDTGWSATADTDGRGPSAPSAPGRTILGEVVEKESSAPDDPDRRRRPMPVRVVLATFAAARRTASWAADPSGVVRISLRYLGHGAWHTAILGWRYVRAHDHQEALGGMASGADWNRVKETRKARWTFLGAASAVAALGSAVGWYTLGWLYPTVAGGTIAALLAAYGRYRLHHQVPVGEIAAEDVGEDEMGPDEPYPLAWCGEASEVAECVSRALFAEGIETRHIKIAARHEWGWEIDIDLKGSTPGKVNAVADQLDSHFDIPRGGTLIEPDPNRSAHITMRLVLGDPFARMAAPVAHAPNSLSVRDVVVRGRSMDGAPLEFRLRGMSMLVIGVSGSAKTKGALRCIAEAITACSDAIAVEMDPVKGGLREFEGVMAAPPIRGEEACTEWLGYLVRIAKARNDVKHRLGMGDLWEPSPEHPSVFGIVDEFIYLPSEAKKLAIELLRLGRETGVHLIFAAQESTADSLGDAIADSVTYRVMLASRFEDIRLVMGAGAGAEGWRPDRLRPAVDDVRVFDAGRCYIKGPGFDRPILWKWDRFGSRQIAEAVAERKTAGRPGFDEDSLVAADLLHLARLGRGDAPRSVADRVQGLDHVDAAAVSALVRLFDERDASWLPTRDILSVLEARGWDGGSQPARTLGLLLRRHAPAASASKDESDVRGWERRWVDEAASAMLRDPSGTRR